MSETYLVNNRCTFQPPSLSTATQITMPVTKQGNPNTPVFTIIAHQGSSTSREIDTISPGDRWANIYFTQDQFTALKANVNTKKKVYVTYDATADQGDDRITGQRVNVNS